jgi:DNA-binding NtrC family response regulator
MSMPGGTINPEHLSPDLAVPETGGIAGPHAAAGVSRAVRPGNLAAAIEEVEREMITVTLDRTSGNISETARVLGLTRRGLYLKLRRLGLDGVLADTQ